MPFLEDMLVPWRVVCVVFDLNMGEDSKNTISSRNIGRNNRFNLPILVAKERIAGSTGLPLGNTDGVIVVQEDQTVAW